MTYDKKTADRGEQIDDPFYPKTAAQCRAPCTEIRAAIRRPNRIRLIRVVTFYLHKTTGAVVNRVEPPLNLLNPQKFLTELGKFYDIPAQPDGVGREFFYREGRCASHCLCRVPAGAQPVRTRNVNRTRTIVWVEQVDRELIAPIVDPQGNSHIPDMLTVEQLEDWLPDFEQLLPHTPGQPYKTRTSIRYEATFRVPMQQRQYVGTCVPALFDPSIGVA